MAGFPVAPKLARFGGVQYLAMASIDDKTISSFSPGEGGYDASGWETLRDVNSVGH
jgi:hypothetical protein